MIGASALRCRCPAFQRPNRRGARKVINDRYVLGQPGRAERSKLDTVVAGTEAAVLMVESAELLGEDTMLGAVVFGLKQQQVVIGRSTIW